MSEEHIVLPDHLERRIEKRIGEIAAVFPDIDREWLRNEMRVQALTYHVPPEAVSLKPLLR